MADAGSHAVYRGFWRDQDQGLVQGATLTLTNREAAALLAFLAIVVTFAANRSFKICRFGLHRLFHPSAAGTDSGTWAKRRRQVILRNSETAGGALLSLLETAISEGFRSPVSARASVLLKLFVIAHWLAFIASGILTSRIIVGRTVVSRVTSTCGRWMAMDPPSSDSTEELYEWQSATNELWLNGTLDAQNYVQNCYDDDQSTRGFFDCTKFVKRSLPHSEEHNVTCPFEQGFCLAGENSAFAMDTGNISFSSLGINKLHAKDLSVRRRSTCAVVDSLPFYIGPLTADDGQGGNDTAFAFSFWTDDGANSTLPYRIERSTSAYNLQEFPLTGSQTGQQAAEALQPNRSSNDVSIILLRGLGVTFLHEQDDPWFSVHEEVQYDDSTGYVQPGFKRYQMDHFLNMLVCDERAQFCNHLTGQCTPWHGLLSDFQDLISTRGDPLLKEDMDGYLDVKIAASHVMSALSMTYIARSIQGRGHAALQAGRYFEQGLQFRLNPEQWKVELRYWFNMAIARLQLEIFNTIERPLNVDPERTHNMSEDFPSLPLCGNIKFRSASHTSLSTTGIVVILLVTAILTILSFLDQLMASRFLRGRFHTITSAWEETENVALLKRTMNEVSRERKTTSYAPAVFSKEPNRFADGNV